MEEVLAVIGIFFAPAIMIVLIVWFKSRERIKRYELQADLYAKSLENGQPVSTDWFVEPEKKSTSLKSGLICMAIGIGISLSIWLAAVFVGKMDREASMVFMTFSSVGIIPFLIGIAFVINHSFEKKKDAIKNRIRNAQ